MFGFVLSLAKLAYYYNTRVNPEIEVISKV